MGYEQEKSQAASAPSGGAALPDAPKDATSDLKAMTYDEAVAHLAPGGSAESAKIPSGATVEASKGGPLAGSSISGSRTDLRYVDPETGEVVDVERVVSSASSRDVKGGQLYSQTDTRAVVSEVVYQETTLAEAKAALGRALVPLELEREELATRIAQAKAGQQPTEALEQELLELDMEITRRDSELQDLSFDEWEQVVTDHGIDPGEVRQTVTKGFVSSASTDVQVDWTSGQATGKRSTSEAHHDGQGTVETSDKSESLTVGYMNGGAGAKYESVEKDTVVVDGEEVASSSSSRSVTGSVNAEGVTLGGSASDTGVTGDKQTTSGSATVGTNKVSGTLDHSQAVKDGAYTHTFSVGGTGSVLMDVKLVPGSDPPTYQSEFTVTLGAKGSVGTGAEGEKEVAGGKASASASGSLSAGASAAFTHKRTLSPEEVARYELELKDWEATGKAPTLSDFAVLQRLQALGDEIASNPLAGTTSLLGNAEAASSLATGESLSITTTVNGSASGSAGVKGGGMGVSASGSISGEASRTVSVSSPKEGVVSVTIAIASKSSKEGGLAGEAAGVSASYKAGSGSGGGQSATFNLASGATEATHGYSYDAVYKAILGCLSQDQVEAVASRYAPLGIVAGRTETRSRQSSEAVGVGYGGQELTFKHEGESSSAVTYGGDGSLSGSTSGKSKSSLSGAGVELLAETDTGAVTVDQTGAATGTFGRQEDVIGQGVVATWNIKDLLTKSYPHYSEISLTAQEMELLIARTADETKWQLCCPYSQYKPTWNAWAELRRQLMSPTPDPKWVDQDPAVALKLAQAVAIAQFMENPDAYVAVRNCAQNYGNTDTTADYGTRSEWPRVIADEKAKLEAARASLAALPGRLMDDLGDLESGQERGLERCKALKDELQRIREALKSNESSFRDRSALLEMLEGVDADVATVDGELRAFSASWGADTETPTAKGAAAAEVARLEGLLREFKSQELQLFAIVRDNTGSQQAGALGKYWTLLTASDSQVYEAWENIKDLYERWKPKVIELRGAYMENDQIDGWKVSSCKSDPRNLDHEPDAKGWKYFLTSWGAEQSFVDTRTMVPSDWYERYTKY